MHTLDLIAALIAAIAQDDVSCTATLLETLEARLQADELADRLERIFNQLPGSVPTRLTLCA